MVGQGWIASKLLEAGDELSGPAEVGSAVTSNARDSRPDRITVYNMEVAGSHSYFVRAEGSEAEPVWVHNNCDTETGSYRDLGEDLRGTGEQANHLNQDAAFRSVIPTEDGIANAMQGNAFVEPGTPHYDFHEHLEGFWSQFRRGGVRAGQFPTNAEYGTALTKSLRAGGYNAAEARMLASRARAQRLEYGLMDWDLVPRVPDALRQVQR